MTHRRNDPVRAEHLQRRAYLYVRQSTLHQVLENTESTRRQYDLRGRAVALGWAHEQIVVIDDDLGVSAAAAGRTGFQRLVADVGLRQAGIVMGLEVSRLARNSSDWHRLLEICALTDTLILDEDGVYDPAHFNDRLLLGLKGTMSEAELHLLRARLQGGYLAKARRGELRIRLPVGFVYDAADHVQLDPDRQVRDAIALLFATFRRDGSAGAVVTAFHAQGLRFPSRPPHGPRMGELVWNALTYSRTLDVLHNPRYAGAYVLGRTEQRKSPGGRSTKQRPREQWTVLLHDAHAGYLSWDAFEEHQRRLHENHARYGGGTGTTPPREGPALLQGVALCGVCGRRMQVHYHQRQGQRVPSYVCPRGPLRWAAPQCQTIPGASIDDAIAALVLDAVTPLALEVALSVHQELEVRVDEADRCRREHVERARYEAEAARRRYMRIDPDNRLVADALEADWNEKLRALATAQHDYERRRAADEARLGPEQRQHIAALATDFPAVWHARATSDRDRKRMLRLIIEDVTLRKGEQELAVQVRFHGGATRSLSLPRPLAAWKNWLTPEDVVAEIDRLLNDHTAEAIARQLNERGFRSGKGHRFHGRLVGLIQRTHGLRSRHERLRARGLLTADEMAAQAGVSRQTILRWRRAGRVRAYSCNDKDQCLYDPAAGVPTRNQRPRHVPAPGVLESTKEVQCGA